MFLLVTMSGGLHTYVPVGDDVWWVTHICHKEAINETILWVIAKTIYV